MRWELLKSKPCLPINYERVLVPSEEKYYFIYLSLQSKIILSKTFLS